MQPFDKECNEIKEMFTKCLYNKHIYFGEVINQCFEYEKKYVQCLSSKIKVT